ncbi:MAG TPA: hypothetical protein PLT93_16300 [Phycisphaerae bacterium]|nr:hypothetical protein [Phycisphaerae bacterium]HON67432.1 hypothetical protein [Phycisphaerae bacterium]HPZ99696.1 hypothetical protein [Phycisphaerae bacterium]
MRVDQRQANACDRPGHGGEITFPFRLNPQHLGGPVLAAVEEGRVADLDVREAMVFLDHLNADGAGAVETGPADLARCERFQQHSEPPSVFCGRHDAAQGDALSEGLLVLGRLDDRSANTEHLELRPG